MRVIILTILFFFGINCTSFLLSADIPRRVKELVDDAITIRQMKQREEDRWEKEKKRLLTEYRRLEEEKKMLLSKNRDLKERVLKQKDLIARLEVEIAEIERMIKEMEPFIRQTYERLSRSIEEDVPFLRDEREARITRLRKIIDDPSISIGEKFRKLMEALFIEAEYGNTIETYKEKISLNGKDILVDVFRLGRVSLFFQTIDKRLCGYFDPATSSWKVLPSRFNRSIDSAIEMASKRRSIDILNLPIGRLRAR